MTGGEKEEAVRDEGNILLKRRIQDMDEKHFDILTRVSSSGEKKLSLSCLSVNSVLVSVVRFVFFLTKTSMLKRQGVFLLMVKYVALVLCCQWLNWPL